GGVLGMTTGGLLRGRPLTIPASTLTRIGEELVSKGRVATPYVGLVMQPVQLPTSLQDKSGIKAATGLLVMHVEAGGPAHGGGVLLGDILVQMDHDGFEALEDLQNILTRRGINSDVDATIIRGGQKVELRIRIGERPIR